MDEMAYTIPPGMSDLARIWDTEVSAIRPHLLDVDLSNPFTSNAKHRITHTNYPKETRNVNTDTHACMPIRNFEHSTQIPVGTTTQEPTFHTSQTDANSLPDSFTQLLMEAEHAIQTMDCYNPTPFDSNNIPMRFPKVGMGYQEDTVESCIRASTGGPPLVTLRSYERHWKRSGVYQWRKPTSLGNNGVLLEDKPKYQRKRNKVMKNISASKEQIKKTLITHSFRQSGILELPNELIHIILSYLPLSSLLAVSVACKRIYLLSNSPFLYTHLNLSRMSITADNLNWIISKQPKHLNLTNSVITISDSQTQILFQGIAPQLQSLSVYPGATYSLKGDQICHFLSQNDTQYLTSLQLNWVGVTDYGLSCILSLTALTTLSLAGSNHITDRAVIPLIIKFQTTLTRLELSSCIQLTNRTGSVVATCISLSYLGLANCYKMTDRVFKLILDSLEQLEYLDLHSNPALAETDQSVLEGLATCTKLRSLNLSDAINITDSHITHILPKLTLLDHLNLSNCKLTESFVTSLCQARLSNLSYLDISGLPITSLSLSAIASAYQPTLSVLVLNSCIRVTQNSICKLIDKCRRLETLSVFDTKIYPIPKYLIKSKVNIIGTSPMPLLTRNFTQ